MKRRVITAAWLRKHKACEDQVVTFEKEWGDSAKLTRKNLLRAAKLRLDLGWLAIKLGLSAESRRVYDAAVAELLWTAIYRAEKE